mmetsp:Transcript_729/g.2257  ORF Transcript_729/g.2257 Transcript_729/m.2257 type:complete len:206 (+) Transcript_729:412-1029(+)
MSRVAYGRCRGRARGASVGVRVHLGRARRASLAEPWLGRRTAQAGLVVVDASDLLVEAVLAEVGALARGWRLEKRVEVRLRRDVVPALRPARAEEHARHRDVRQELADDRLLARELLAELEDGAGARTGDQWPVHRIGRAIVPVAPALPPVGREKHLGHRHVGEQLAVHRLGARRLLFKGRANVHRLVEVLIRRRPRGRKLVLRL